MSWDGWVSVLHSTAQCSAAQGRQKMQPPQRRGGLPHVGLRQLTPHARRGMGPEACHASRAQVFAKMNPAAPEGARPARKTLSAPCIACSAKPFLGAPMYYLWLCICHEVQRA